MKIAICDDDKEYQEKIEGYIKQIDVSSRIKVKRFDSGESLVEAYKWGQRFSIILLDIQMSALNGIETAKIIRKYDQDVIIIIMTSILEYAVDGYSVNAFDFMLKPIEIELFIKVLNRAQQKLKNHEKKVYQITTRSATSYLKLSDILYLESSKKKVRIHALEGIYMSNDNITLAENKLAEEGFIRISRFYLVNMLHISEIKVGTISLKKGIILNYSEKFRSQIKRRYMEYMMGEL